MWLNGKEVDHISQKEQVFTDLCRECRTIAPGAMLSYKLQTRLERFKRKERCEMVSRTLDGCAPLFFACQRGNTEVVEFLITTCDANVDQRGLYQSLDDRSVHHVTPLWCAAVAGKLTVVTILVEHGADVNSVSDTGSTPVRSACFMTHRDIVIYLVDHGADFKKPNYNGGTCLINSIQSVRLSSYLISQGADVNAQDIQKKTALHYAIQEHRLETTKLLLGHGAKPFIKSKYDDDALQTACINGAYLIFEYIIEQIEYSPSRISDGYELLGSTYLDEHHDVQVAIQYWKKAATIRSENGIVKCVQPPSKPFQYIQEFSTLEELEEISSDLDIVRTQSLLICERILGTTHKDMIFRLMYRGAAYADSIQYEKCIDLWLYALALRIKRDTILFNETCLTAQALVRLYLDMVEKLPSSDVKFQKHLRKTLKYEDVYYTLKLLCSELEEAVNLLRINPVYKRQQSNFDIILKILIYLIYVLNQLNLTHKEECDVAAVLNKVLRLDPRTNQGGYSILHLSAMKCNAIYNNCLLDDQHVTPFPAVDVVKFVLRSGAKVDVTTSDKGLSPLYVASQLKNFKPEVVDVLIKAGAHIDQATVSGEMPSSLLARNSECNIDLIALTSLKCLSAKVIQFHNIPYKGEVPVHLESFISIH